MRTIERVAGSLVLLVGLLLFANNVPAQRGIGDICDTTCDDPFFCIEGWGETCGSERSPVGVPGCYTQWDCFYCGSTGITMYCGQVCCQETLCEPSNSCTTD